MRWSIASTDEFMGVYGCLSSFTILFTLPHPKSGGHVEPASAHNDQAFVVATRLSCRKWRMLFLWNQPL